MASEADDTCSCLSPLRLLLELLELEDYMSAARD